MTTVGAEIKRTFFDRRAVRQAVGKATANFYGKAGAFIRTTARSSMRRRKTPSMPGSPPSVHSRSKVATLRNIQFGYDFATDSLVIGPLKLNQYGIRNGIKTTGTVPALHEYGGIAGILEKKMFNFDTGEIEWERTSFRGAEKAKRRGQKTRVRQATYPARPFMGPALEKEAPNFPNLFVIGPGGSSARRGAA